ncbi:MAG: cryptochrome/photolyase family protein [Pontimonas sp.]
MDSAQARLLFADQLGPHFDDGGPILLPEVLSPLRRRTYHRQKAHLILSALRHRAHELGERVELLRGDSYHEALSGRSGSVINPTSRGLRSLLADLSEAQSWEVLPSRGFVTSEEDFSAWKQRQGSKRLLMENFYRERRMATGALMTQDSSGAMVPEGGKFNFDHHNREPPPVGQATLGVMPPWLPAEDDIDAEVREYLNHMEARGIARFVGVDGPRLFPATRVEALAALEGFVTHRLATFGPTEDAALKQDWAMSHSLLSPALNLGLLDPWEVINRVLEAYHSGGVDIASAEGFLRQIMGWRDWVWHLYWHLGEEFSQSNYFSHHAEIPPSMQNLDPQGIDSVCLSQVLGELRERGWTHHINRLMVIGSFALQREINPQKLNDWFIDVCVDGTPWVMPANVVGMSQYADGGQVATKPYTSGGAYISKMTDYCTSCPFSPKVRVGEKACHFTAGYWNFLEGHKTSLAGNFRMAQPLAGLGKLKDLPELLAQEQQRERY